MPELGESFIPLFRHPPWFVGLLRLAASKRSTNLLKPNLEAPAIAAESWAVKNQKEGGFVIRHWYLVQTAVLHTSR